MKEVLLNDQNPVEAAAKERTAKMVLYFGMFSIVMLFAGLLSAYIVTSYSELWVNITIPMAFYYSTVVIVISSITLRLAINASKKPSQKNAILFLVVTLLLGIAFGVFQFNGWTHLTQIGNYFTGSVDSLNGVYGEDYTITYQGKELVYEGGDFYFPNDELHEKPLTNEVSIFGNSASSYLYVLSFVHLLHLLGGLIFFVAILAYGFLSSSKTVSPMRMRLGGIYWNFLGGLWLF